MSDAGSFAGRDNGGHLASVDALRGLAIAMVVMIHSSQLVMDLARPLRDFAFYGVRGVQLFFVVSGLTLVIAYRKSPPVWPDFAARRVFRIAPMFYLAAIFYLALGRWEGFASGTRDASSLDVAATFLFLHGWFPSAINKVVPGGWSIAAEAMFYLVFPLLLAAAQHPRRLALIVAATYILAGITNVALVRLVPGDPEFRAFAMEFWLCQLPAFAGGCLLGSIFDRPMLGYRAARLLLFFIALALILDSQMRGRSNLLVAIMLLTALAWLVPAARLRFFQSGLLPFLGRISFSLYLVHFFVLDLIRPFCRAVENGIGPSMAFMAIFGATMCIAAVLAAFCYKYIELPFIRLGRNVGNGLARQS